MHGVGLNQNPRARNESVGVFGIKSGQEHNLIILMPRRPVSIAARPAPIQIALNFPARNSQSWGTAEYDRGDPGAVRLSGTSNSKKWTP